MTTSMLSPMQQDYVTKGEFSDFSERVEGRFDEQKEYMDGGFDKFDE